MAELPSMQNVPSNMPNLTDESALNQYILKIDSRAAKISVPKPVFEKTKVVMLKTDEKTNEPILNPDGTNIFLEGEIEVFKGFKEELIDFPVPDVFNDDRGKAWLLDSEVHFVHVADHSYSYFMQKYLTTKNEKYLPLLSFISVLVGSTNTASSARHGIRLLMAKSKFTKNTNEEVARINAEEEIKNRGWLGRLNPFGQKQGGGK